jgi:hypothetical protein
MKPSEPRESLMPTTKLCHTPVRNGADQMLRSVLPSGETYCTCSMPSPNVRIVMGPPPGPAPDQCSCQKEIQRPRVVGIGAHNARQPR